MQIKLVGKKVTLRTGENLDPFRYTIGLTLCFRKSYLLMNTDNGYMAIVLQQYSHKNYARNVKFSVAWLTITSAQ